MPWHCQNIVRTWHGGGPALGTRDRNSARIMTCRVRRRIHPPWTRTRGRTLGGALRPLRKSIIESRDSDCQGLGTLPVRTCACASGMPGIAYSFATLS